MPVELKTDVKEKYIHVTASGEFELEQAKQAIFEVIQVCHDNQIARVLTDVSQLSADLDLMDRYEYVLFLVGGIKQHFSHILSDIRLAYVGAVTKDDTYSPQVVQQSGVNILSTDNMDDAVNWLQQDEI